MPRGPRRHEVLLGRSLAVCAHPHAAWRLGVPAFRLVIVGGYFAAGFVAAFAALLLLR
jgi:ribose/xylose/arabinose/galactoside ABC-type transport system permease subunit